MTSLKVHINREKSSHAGGCQFCQHELKLEEKSLVFTSRYVYIFSVANVRLRFCPRHLREFFNQEKAELRRIRRNLKRKLRGNKDK